MIIEMAGDAGCAEEGTEHILFLAVEIHLERFDIRQRTEFGFTVFRFEVIMVLRDVTDEIYHPSVVWFITDICLIINKTWPVLSSCFERA